MIVVHADCVVRGDADEIRDGAVVLDDSGRVLDVGQASEVIPSHAGIALERVHGVVMPGLVNAHTHLELSALRGQVPGGAGFLKWVDHLIAVRAEQGPEQDAAAIDGAVAELDAFGTAAVGEVTNTLAAVPALVRLGIAGCVFHEVVGVLFEQASRRLEELPEVVRSRLDAWPDGDLAYAPSPHALYTTHSEVIRRVMKASAHGGSRVSVHLGEHASERRFLESGDGPILEWMTSRLGLARTQIEWPGMSPVEFADSLGLLAPHVACVHLTDARPEELARVAASGAHAVFCPRSNLYIEVRFPPLLAARAAGLLPALGTDSLASNSSLDVLAEASSLRQRFPSVPAHELVRMATWQGALALGRGDVGRIAVGSRPGLLAIEGDPGDDACAFILKSVAARRRWIVRRLGQRPSLATGHRGVDAA